MRNSGIAVRSDGEMARSREKRLGVPARILLVDDDYYFSELTGIRLNEAGYSVCFAKTLCELRTQLEHGPYDFFLLDLDLGTERGLDGLPLILEQSPGSPVIVFTGHGTISAAMEAIRRGAAAFLEKSEDFDPLLKRLRGLGEKTPPMPAMELIEFGRAHGIYGESQKLLRVLELIVKFRNLDATVLICGESGTGKELVARSLHVGSVRGARPFRAVNCGALPPQLLESELFGYRKGAFTDAKSDRPGLFEVCHQGTLFLDEIGELTPQLQVKFLRVLQEREFIPLGSNNPVKVDVRVIAASNRDLGEEVEGGKFRSDLFHRLSVLQIALPPLRERVEDIPLLVADLLKALNERYGKNVPFPDLEFLSRLMLHSWPGNIRELKNVLERAVVLSEAGVLQMPDLEGRKDRETKAEAPTAEERLLVEPTELPLVLQPLDTLRNQLERNYLRAALEAARGNIAEVARVSGCHRTEIYRMLRRHLLDPEQFRAGSRTEATVS